MTDSSSPVGRGILRSGARSKPRFKLIHYPVGAGSTQRARRLNAEAQQPGLYLQSRREGFIRLAVLVSGSGSNLQALLDAAVGDPDFGARIVVVISDRNGVLALSRAAAAGIPVVVVPWSEHRGRDSFTTAVCDAAERYGVDAMILAGFMRILGPEAIRRYPRRILNIHPALLPSFPGAHAVPQAIAHGVKVSGVTVHFVDEEVDHGPIIAQRPVSVLPGDTEETLHARIQSEEHKLYPEVVKAFAAGRLEVQGRTVIWL